MKGREGGRKRDNGKWLLFLVHWLYNSRFNVSRIFWAFRGGHILVAPATALTSLLQQDKVAHLQTTCLTTSLPGQSAATWPLLPARKLITCARIAPAFTNLRGMKSGYMGYREPVFLWFLLAIFFFSKLKQKKW